MNYSNYYPSSGLLHVSIPTLMGTRMDVLLFGNDKQQLECEWSNAELELRKLERMLNRFDSHSEVANVNKNAQFSEVRLSDELWHILQDCRRYHEGTGGYFDVTWQDFDKIEFMEESHNIRFHKYGMSLDFGAYAKGYALKKVRTRLVSSGIQRALVNFGNSSVLALGTHPHGNSWPVGIEDAANGSVLSTIRLCDTSLSVSGNTPSHQSHIMNPKTSEFIDGDRMVAIVADDPADADVLTTAWIASGSETHPDWMLKFNLNNTYKIK